MVGSVGYPSVAPAEESRGPRAAEDAVSIPCSGCGRTYDEARFEGGRTLWCTCGGRVGMRVEGRHPRADERHRFFADAMPGRLSRGVHPS
jgi:hypothetical protein